MSVTWQPAPHPAALEIAGITTDRHAIHVARCSATPDALWVADVSQIWAGSSWLHFAFVIDNHTRRCLGWWPHRVLHPELLVGAINAAIAGRSQADIDRRPAVPIVFGHRCREAGIDFPHWATSAGRDAVVARAFVTALRAELLDAGEEDTWASHPEAESTIRAWIADQYNRDPNRPRRRPGDPSTPARGSAVHLRAGLVPQSP